MTRLRSFGCALSRKAGVKPDPISEPSTFLGPSFAVPVVEPRQVTINGVMEDPGTVQMSSEMLELYRLSIGDYVLMTVIMEDVTRSTLGTVVAPNDELPMDTIAIGFEIARNLSKKDGETVDMVGAHMPVATRVHVLPFADTLYGAKWTYAPPEHKEMNIRSEPNMQKKTGPLNCLKPLDHFEVSEVKTVDGVRWLRLADGRGWVYEMVKDTIFCKQTVVVQQGILFSDYLQPKFWEAYLPLLVGNLFVASGPNSDVDFMVCGMEEDGEPIQYGIIGPDTVIHCEGSHLQREDKSVGWERPISRWVGTTAI